MADRVGQQFGNYRLVALVGEGGYAQVYLGQHVRLTLQAAIKVLHTHLNDQEAEHFQQEAQTIATLAHSAMVRILDFDVQNGIPFLVLEYAPNGSLRKLHPPGTQPPLQTIVSYVTQVAAALQYMHDHQVIHRDVKPENMLVGRHQQVLLSDFGLAALAYSTVSEVAQGTMGTLAYMAPEQIEGHPRAASDQYALGVVVYEWLCGKPPFQGSMRELIVQHLSLPPPPLRERASTIPVKVEKVVLKALAKDPKQRFGRVQDFALALQAACRPEAFSDQTPPILTSQQSTEAWQAPIHNLPAQLTSLIGREQEVAAACTLLHRPDARLLTLTGTGGVGKTRLALQVATELLEDFPDGVSFVPLAPISDPDLVMPTIAQVLEVKETLVQSLLDLLKAALRDKHLLLVLDNFEQILPAAPHLTDLLAACPQLKLLVTSRATLHIQGEHEFPVPPLALPDLAHLPEPAALSHAAAVTLFLERAQASKPTFQITPANARAIAEICVRLDGLPLAIELAAARIKLLPPQALLARLGQRLSVLMSGARDVPERQQTLRNTISWSYNLLDVAEQRLFGRLSVFVGGCTLEATEAIYVALEGDQVAGQILEGVASLIDKSLLQQTEQEGEQPRLVMLETIREYGLECLNASETMEATRQAHAEYYLALAEKAEPELVGPQQAKWLERLEQEQNNLRAAMQWGFVQSEDADRNEMALRLGGALWQFWLTHNHWSEGRTLLERALAGSKGVAASVRAKALITAANLANMQADNDRAEALAGESLELCQELGDIRGIALSLRLLGVAAVRRRSYTAARSLNEDALALFRESGDKEGAAWSLKNLADLFIHQGEYARGCALFEESLALHRELGNKSGIADLLQMLAKALFESLDDQASVRALFEEGLALSREVGDKHGIASYFVLSGRLALSQGDAATAHSLAEESLALVRELGKREYIADSLLLLARVATAQGDQVTARALYEQCLAIMKALNDKQDLEFYLLVLAEVVVALGEPVWAARLWGAAEVLREAGGTPIPPVEHAAYAHAVDAARAQLGEKAFAAAWAEGRGMTFEQVLTAKEPMTRPTLVPTTHLPSPPPDK